ncbi:hypothetical protein D7Z26_25430 [Cohnella endophytica]|uniref:PpiC domain-containing protein n=1 Tax=Cohnella endophytica TaxID=2419778 RepID=A0A494XCU5_9BACL|nr:peptidylprolyl isomerase [Cohnella endophytica]RKP45403.1 hypothetical protein D7Z26_25430 [Cohnella endophytica]
MRETIRQKPLVLLALLAILAMITGCKSSGTSAPSPSPGGTAPQTNATEDDIVATIEGSSFSRQQLIDRLLSTYGAHTLRSMMLLEAVKEEANSLGVEVTDAELEQELRQMKQGYESEEAFYREMEEQLGMNREEVLEDARYRLLLEKLSIRDVKVTPSEIDRYIDEHREDFVPRRQYRLSQIIVQTKGQAEDLLASLTKGADFAELARTYSVDEFTADEGGDAGWIEAGDPFTDPGIMQAATDMQVGDVTGPVKTDQGYAIVKLEGRSEIKTRSESEIRSAAERQIALGKAVPMKDFEQSLLDKYHAEVKDRILRP